MKGVVIKSYTCPCCGDGVRLVRAGTYVRCSCGTVGLFGYPEDPGVVCSALVKGLQCTPVIVSMPDDYKSPKVRAGGIIYANPRRGKMTGVTAAQMDLIMPLLAFMKMMSWDSSKLLEALKAFEDYDAMIENDF